MSDENPIKQNEAPGPLIFPLWQSETRWRRLLKVAIGNVLLTVRPSLKKKLESGAPTQGVAQRVAMTALIDRHRRADTLESLSQLHRNFWAGERSSAFYSLTRSRFEKVFLGRHKAIVDTLKGIAASRKFHTICEIGCGSGQVLEFLNQQLPEVEQLIGLDLNARQMDVNRQRFQNESRMQFIAADAAEWIPQHIGSDWILVCYGGVLEYFTQPQVRALFHTIAANAPACIALVEPLAADQDLSAPGPSRAYGMELSYSHPYVHLLEEAGLQVTWRQDTSFGDNAERAIMLVATTVS